MPQHLFFNQADNGQSRATRSQWAQVMDIRQRQDQMTAINALQEYMPADMAREYAFFNDSGMQINEGRSPADLFREFDPTVTVDKRPWGEYATLDMLLNVSRSINVGRLTYEYARSSRLDSAQRSMSGQLGVKLDNVNYRYDGVPLPIFDAGFGRNWREMERAGAEGFDLLVDDSREAERSIKDNMDDYLWNGDSSIVVDSAGSSLVWNGIRNDTTHVAQYTIVGDLTSNATAATAIRDQFKNMRDVLWITNNCTKDLQVGVSRQIYSRLELEFSTADGVSSYTVRDAIMRIGGLVNIYVDNRLDGNQVAMSYMDVTMGFHSIVGMAMMTVAEPRFKYNDDFRYVKSAAVTFLPKIDHDDRKCAVYGSN